VVDCPCQVSPHGVVDSDVSIGSIFAAYLRIDVVECGSKEGEDIKTPIKPSGESLPFLQCETMVVCSKIGYGGYELSQGIMRHCHCQSVSVDLNSDDGED